MSQMIDSADTPRDEYVTIIARTVSDAMRQFQARGLDARGFALMGRIDRHRFALVGEDRETSEMFEGENMVAATFCRRVNA